MISFPAKSKSVHPDARNPSPHFFQAAKVGKKSPSGVKQAAGQMKSANDYAFDEDGEPG